MIGSKRGASASFVAKGAQLVTFLDLPKLGERELRSPDLTLAAKTVSSDQFQPKK